MPPKAQRLGLAPAKPRLELAELTGDHTEAERLHRQGLRWAEELGRRTGQPQKVRQTTYQNETIHKTLTPELFREPPLASPTPTTINVTITPSGTAMVGMRDIRAELRMMTTIMTTIMKRAIHIMTQMVL